MSAFEPFYRPWERFHPFGRCMSAFAPGWPTISAYEKILQLGSYLKQENHSTAHPFFSNYTGFPLKNVSNTRSPAFAFTSSLELLQPIFPNSSLSMFLLDLFVRLQMTGRFGYQHYTTDRNTVDGLSASLQCRPGIPYLTPSATVLHLTLSKPI